LGHSIKNWWGSNFLTPPPSGVALLWTWSRGKA